MTTNTIKVYEQNAKIHTDKQLEALAKVVKEVGWRQNIEVNQQGTIVAGHGRWLSYEKFGHDYNLPEPWVTDDKGKTIMGEHATFPLTEEQEKMWRLADNQLNAMTGFDMDLAIPDLKALSEEMFELTGFSSDLLIEDDEKDDAIPEVPVVPQSKQGDLYELGPHRVLCGDSIKQTDLELLMNGQRADMVFTDPPWNVDYGNTPKDNAQGYKVRTILNDNMGENFIPFLKDAFAMMSAYSKDGAPTYVVMSAQEWGGMMEAMKDNQYHWSSTIIWKKDRLVMSRKDYHTQYEPIWYGWKEGSRLKVVEDRKQSDVWEIKRPSDSPLHPTTKPIELVQQAIINSSEVENIILEQFLGSGSTLIAAEKTDRICYGIELDPKYVDVIIQRWVDYTGITTIKKNGKEITWKIHVK